MDIAVRLVGSPESVWQTPRQARPLPHVLSNPPKKEHGMREKTKKLSIYLVGEKEMDVCSWGLVVSLTKC